VRQSVGSSVSFRSPSLCGTMYRSVHRSRWGRGRGRREVKQEYTLPTYYIGGYSYCKGDQISVNYTFTIIDKKQLDRIQRLWEKLNEVHLNDSIHFKEHYSTFTFKERCLKFEGIPDDNVRIETVQDNESCIGYCISTINDTIGEIDSIFVESGFRKYGFGKRLVENSIQWLKMKKCQKIMVGVAAGHESVFKFYQKFDFYPRMTYLQLKE
jgi:diamine N-acetyltransferase